MVSIVKVETVVVASAAAAADKMEVFASVAANIGALVLVVEDEVSSSPLNTASASAGRVPTTTMRRRRPSFIGSKLRQNVRRGGGRGWIWTIA